MVETLTAIKMTKRELFCLLRSIKRKSVQNGLSLSGMHFLKVKQSKVNDRGAPTIANSSFVPGFAALSLPDADGLGMPVAIPLRCKPPLIATGQDVASKQPKSPQRREEKKQLKEPQTTKNTHTLVTIGALNKMHEYPNPITR